MSDHKYNVKSNFTLPTDLAQQMRGPGSDIRIALYCGLANTPGSFTPVDVAFPQQLEVKINDSEVKANFKGLKNKPGSTKPADITSYVRKLNQQQNRIDFTYAHTTKRYAYTVYLVRYVDANKLTERIKRHGVIRKQTVLDKMRRANADEDLAATSFRMSLKDPISTLRINLPVRSSHCAHYQCFDGNMFMQLQEQAPQWSCPVCSKILPFDSLCVDEYFQEILNATTKSTEKIDVEPDGTWTIIKEDEDSEAVGPSGKKPRASYDDDFDDLVEVEQPGGQAVNAVKRESQSQASLPSPLATRPTALDTPPMSSREASVAQSASSGQRNKRPQSAVIDLTLSDDDEQPPRSAKRRQQNGPASANGSTNSYNTPSSISDQRLHPAQGLNNNQSRPSYQQRPDEFRSASVNSDPQANSPALYNISQPSQSHSPVVFGQTSMPVHPRAPSHSNSLPPRPPAYAGNGNPSSLPNGTIPAHSPFSAQQSAQPRFSPQSHQTSSNSPGISSGGLQLPPMQPQAQHPHLQHTSGFPSSAMPGGFQGTTPYNYGSATPPG
jgi:E3 SUMO-protein ligase PIAS1